MTRSDQRRRGRSLQGVTICGVLLLSALPFWSGCDDRAPEKTQTVAPKVMLQPRKFKGPGDIAQTLATNGRLLVFLELTSSVDGSPLEVDPAWTFTMTAKDPTGAELAVSLDPVVPRTWANDSGIRLIGGFTAPKTGVYQIEIKSENCPYGKAPFVLLPIM